MSRNVFLSLALVAVVLAGAYFYTKDGLHAVQLSEEDLPVCENPYGQLATFYKPERLVIDLSAEDEGLPMHLSPFFKRDRLVKFIQDTAEKNFAECLTRGRSGVVLFDGRSGKVAGKDLVKDENLILSLSLVYYHDPKSTTKGMITCQFFRSGLPPHVMYLNDIRSGADLRLVKKEGLSEKDVEQAIEAEAVLFLDDCLHPVSAAVRRPANVEIGFMPH